MARLQGNFQVVYKRARFEFTLRESGGYDASVPTISNCASGGETFEEALNNTFEALMVRCGGLPLRPVH